MGKEILLKNSTGNQLFPYTKDNLIESGDMKISDKIGDKDYEINSEKGLGRIYIHKVKSLAQQFTKANTVYIIQYDHNLNNETLNLPENSILKFEGGSFYNGTLNGNNSCIININNNFVIFKDITITGTWNCENIYDTWFYYDENANDHNLLVQNCFQNLTSDNVFNNIYFNRQVTYKLQDIYNGRVDLGTIVKPFYAKLTSDEYRYNFEIVKVRSNCKINLNSIIKLNPTRNGIYIMFSMVECENVEWCGSGTISGDVYEHIYDTPFIANSTYYGEWGYCILGSTIKNVVFKDITIQNSFGDGLGLSPHKIFVYETEGDATNQNSNIEFCEDPITKKVEITNIKILNCRRNGISGAGYDIHVNNVIFKNNGTDDVKGTAPRVAIDWESDYKLASNQTIVCKRCIMSNCTFEDNYMDISSTNACEDDDPNFGVIIENCHLTKPLRLNVTQNLLFRNCYIPRISSSNNTIGAFTSQKNIVYENCTFDELGDYIEFSQDNYNQKIINPNSTTAFKQNYKFFLNKNTYCHRLKFKKSGRGIIKLKIYNGNRDNNFSYSEYEYRTIGNGRLKEFSCEKIITTINHTNNELVLPSLLVPSKLYIGKIKEDENGNIEEYISGDNSEYIDGNYEYIYLKQGHHFLDEISEENSTNYSNLIFYVEVEVTYLDSIKTYGSVTNSNLTAISGHEHYDFGKFTREPVTVENVPEDVVFLIDDIFNVKSYKQSFPKYYGVNDHGKSIYCNDILNRRFPCFYSYLDNTFYDANGFPFTDRRGSLNKFLSKDENAIGSNYNTKQELMMFMNISTHTPVMWNGYEWINLDGSLLNDVIII